MALHRDIYWVGKQWAVTGHGIQACNQKQRGQFDIAASQLWDDGVQDSVRNLDWVNRDDFDKAIAAAGKSQMMYCAENRGEKSSNTAMAASQPAPGCSLRAPRQLLQMPSGAASANKPIDTGPLARPTRQAPLSKRGRPPRRCVRLPTRLSMCQPVAPLKVTT